MPALTSKKHVSTYIFFKKWIWSSEERKNNRGCLVQFQIFNRHSEVPFEMLHEMGVEILARVAAGDGVVAIGIVAGRKVLVRRYQSLLQDRRVEELLGVFRCNFKKKWTRKENNKDSGEKEKRN